MNSYSTEHQKKIFVDRYRDKENPKETVEGMFSRVATAAALDTITHGMNREEQVQFFYNGMVEERYITAGRPLANLGTNGNGMVFNCFVLPIEDSRRGITSTLADFTEIAAKGGGIGISYSRLRPKGTPTKQSKGTASGPVSFIDVFQCMGGTIKQQGSRGLASMTSLHVSHPDIEEFIKAKTQDGRWPTTNLSVEITDAFIRAVKDDTAWELKWNGKVYNTVSARRLWDVICESAHRNGEPGLLFVDTMNERSPYKGVERIETTNPCNEQPLPPNSACNLGSVILPTFVNMTHNKGYEVDYTGIWTAAYDLTLMLDNLIDVSTYPTPEIEANVKKYRPVGVGAMGLADVLLYCGVPYGDNPEALSITETIVETIADGARAASEDLAAEKGTFPAYDGTIMNFAPRRNITLTSYAPTGTISAFCDVSSGIEPHFGPVVRRKEEIGITVTPTTAIQRYMDFHKLTEIPAHARFSISGPEGTELTIQDHLKILEVVANHCDTSASKTINLPEEATIEDVSNVFMFCWEHGIKGCTVYRTNSRSDAPIQAPTTETTEEELEEDDELIVFEDYTSTPKERPNVLEGRTYKIKPNPQEASIYITINDSEDAPFELFFTTNNAVHQEYLDGLSRAITALWRRGVRGDFLFDDFCRYESPSGGTFYEYEPGKHKRLKSILDAIGTVIKRHVKLIGCDYNSTEVPERVGELPEVVQMIDYLQCPECKEYGMNPNDKCPTCEFCGFSRCG